MQPDSKFVSGTILPEIKYESGRRSRFTGSKFFTRRSDSIDKYFRENYDNVPFKSKNLIILVKYG